MRLKTRHIAPAFLAGLLTTTACSDSTKTPSEVHTPASAALNIDGLVSDDNFLFVAGATVPVEVKFYSDMGTEITGIEDTHFAKVTFTPSTLVTAADVAGEHFHKTVAGGADIGSGTVTIGYGHDEAADELSFGPFTVSVVAAAP